MARSGPFLALAVGLLAWLPGCIDEPTPAPRGEAAPTATDEAGAASTVPIACGEPAEEPCAEDACPDQNEADMTPACRYQRCQEDARDPASECREERCAAGERGDVLQTEDFSSTGQTGEAGFTVPATYPCAAFELAYEFSVLVATGDYEVVVADGSGEEWLCGRGTSLLWAPDDYEGSCTLTLYPEAYTMEWQFPAEHHLSYELVAINDVA